MTPEQKLTEMGIDLPDGLPVGGSYVHWKRVGALLYLAGKGPKRADGSMSRGKLGADVTIERGYADARLAGVQLLAMAKQAIGELGQIKSVVKVLGMVNATPDFTEHPQVIDGCSDLFIEALGDKGRHARSAVGVGSLPYGMTVEVEAILEV